MPWCARTSSFPPWALVFAVGLIRYPGETLRPARSHRARRAGSPPGVAACVFVVARSPLRRVMWVDLCRGEPGQVEPQQGVGGDGRGGAGEQAPEGVRAVAGEFHLVGDLG